MKKGFTVLELLVVIGILGLLMGIMLGSMGGSTESARAAKCLSNLHNLASACYSVAMAENYYPRAGSFEIKTRSVGRESIYSEAKGWVSWTSMGAYRNTQKSHKSGAGWFMSTYDSDVEKRIYSLTNGSLWRAVSGNASAYVCPQHTKYAKKKKVEPVWSYVMNGFFCWDETEGSSSIVRDRARRFEQLTRGDRRLLFAELPFNTDNTAQKCSFSTGAGIALDPTLQYEKNELIGFNHKDGKRWYAHVCFADGHTEKLELPKGAGEAQVRKLTEWLCEGADVSYNGSSYEELK